MSDNIVDLIDKELHDVRMHRMNIEQALAEVVAEEKRLIKTREVYTGKPTKPKKTRNGGSKAPQAADEVFGLMQKHADEEFSAPMLTEHVSVSPSTVNKILVHLRETGKIDLIRQGGERGVTKFYKVALAERVSNE